jgi:DNA polymerase V
MHSRESFPDGAAVGPDPSTAPSPLTRGASTGFGSPGTDATVKRIDLNDALIRHPQATFVMRASGDGMCEAGIDDGDVLLVDRAIPPVHGNVVIAVVEGELTCRRLWRQGRLTKLQAANPEHADIVPGDGVQLEVWGVVTTVIKSLMD